MTVSRWIVTIQKWLALIIGLQILLWVLGGLVMSVLPDARLRAADTIAPAPGFSLPLEQVLPADEAAAIAGLAAVETATLTRWHDGPVWRFEGGGRVVTVDALSGLRRSPLDAGAARAVAEAGYAGAAAVANVEYFAAPPPELRSGGATWRVSFADADGTRVYVDAASGEITARRTGLSRVYDVFWRLHVMDYRGRADAGHALLIASAGLALVTVIAALGLLSARLRRTVLARLARRRRRARPLFRPKR
jgi:hypothetical protein